MTATDHRRATAERNVAAILDATVRLARESRSLSMAAIAGEAGVSRVTLYAHFSKLPEVVEAAVERGVRTTLTALESARVSDGPAGEALTRLVDASWVQLARQDALARAAAEHVPAQRLQRAHAPLLAHVRELLRRGREEGAFRADLPVDWLVHVIYTLFHAAADHARAHGIAAEDARAMLQTTIHDVVAGRA